MIASSENESLPLPLDVEGGEEVASLAGKFQPAVLGAHADAIGQWYNQAPILAERNNHGHSVLLCPRPGNRCWG